MNESIAGLIIDMQLDRRKTYYFRDANEVEWRFVWEPIEEIAGWYVWQREPGMSRWFTIGTFPEKKVLAVLKIQPQPLTLDDKIDLGIALQGWRNGEENKNNVDDTPQGPPSGKESAEAKG